MPDSFGKVIRRKQILEELGIDNSTLWAWIKSARFPQPVVLNAGEQREIVAWRENDYKQWHASLPQRMARPVPKTPYPKRQPRKPKLVITRPVE
jgi:predicted DNA-binding transcriptional regulator AlpA